MTTETNEAPGVLDRIANIWAKKKETAQATYARLLKRAELDQKPLTDSETSALAEAMKASGITLDLAERHRDLCRRILEARPKAAKLPQAQAALARAKTALDKSVVALTELQTAHGKVVDEHDVAICDVKSAEDASAKVADWTGHLDAELGGATV